ncbi:MAG: helicase [Torentivirus crutis]|uniref:Replication-associated protein n=1 Tax=Cressdnaviricota sp. TaxID=2748378 RepID=A0A3G2YTJ7_9VIRU|nr:MAG: helicase [Cressdnaviricota sp.]
MPRSGANIDKVKSRHWCWTLNNPEGGAELYDTPEWNLCPIHYMIVGLEFGEEKQTPHHQGYVHWINPRAGSAMRKLLPKAHWEKCLGNETQNFTYCAKDGNLIGEWGDRGTTHDDEEEEPRQGRRSDISAARAMVEEGHSWAHIVRHVTSYSALRVAAEYLTVAEPPRRWKSSVIWIYGPTGTGKTTLATELCQTEPWVSGRTAKWFDGYDAHEDVIFDEFRGDFCTFHELLRFCDALQLRVEVKRGSRQFLAKRIFITSCYPPHLAYNKVGEEILQLGRRIDKIVWIPKQNEMFWKPGTAIGPSDPTTPFIIPVRSHDTGAGGNTEHPLRGGPARAPPSGGLPPAPSPRDDNLAGPIEDDLDSTISEFFE